MKITEKIKEIVNKILGKTKRGAAIGGLIGMATTATLTTGCGDKNKDFKQQYEYDVETPDLGKDNKQGKEQDTIIDRVDHLKTEQDVKDFLNDIYIDETGDDTLKKEDIEISGPHNQDFVYVNKKTGDMITHGEYPDEVKKKMKKNGISYTSSPDDVDVYRVKHKNGKVIDCMTLQSKDKKTEPVRVIIGDQCDEPYESILVKLRNIIPAGLQYAKFIETDQTSNKVVSKEKLKKAIEEFENEKKNENTVEQQTEEKVEELEPGE